MSAQWALPNSDRPALGLEARIQLSGIVKKRQHDKTCDGSCRNFGSGGFDEPSANGWKRYDRFETSGDIGKMVDETMEIAIVELSPRD